MVRFYIFITSAFIIYTGISFYLYNRAKGLVPGRPALIAFRIILAAVSSAFFLSRFLQSYLPLRLFEILLKIGSYWLAVLIFTFIMLACFDAVRLLLKFSGRRPRFLYGNAERTRRIAAAGIFICVCLVLAYGYRNARNIRITGVDIAVPAAGGVMKELNAVFISDIHLGDIITNRELMKFADLINGLDPDIILIAGDIIDNRIDSLKIRNTGEIFLKLKSRLGIYAVTGNHEYFQDGGSAVSYLEQYGIRFLSDEAVLVGGSFYLAGRIDRSVARYGIGKRKPLREITGGLDRRYPVILMDHQPFDLGDAEEEGIDLQLSGHTHGGQFFPGNILVGFLFEKAWGHHRRGKTQYYITSGIGSWGPAIRVGSVPEIVRMKIRFVGPSVSAESLRQ